MHSSAKCVESGKRPHPSQRLEHGGSQGTRLAPCASPSHPTQVDGQKNLKRNKAPLAILFTVAMIALSVSEVLDLLTAALIATAGLMITRCLTSVEVG